MQEQCDNRIIKDKKGHDGVTQLKKNITQDFGILEVENNSQVIWGIFILSPKCVRTP